MHSQFDLAATALATLLVLGGCAEKPKEKERAPMKLEICGERTIVDPSDEDIRSALGGLDAGSGDAFVILGAVLEGGAGIETLKGLTRIDLEQAVITSVAAAITVTLMTVLGVPVSTSQAVVGAIVGMGFMNRQINLLGLEKVVACWFGAPVGGAMVGRIKESLQSEIRVTLEREGDTAFSGTGRNAGLEIVDFAALSGLVTGK